MYKAVATQREAVRLERKQKGFRNPHGSKQHRGVPPNGTLPQMFKYDPRINYWVSRRTHTKTMLLDSDTKQEI